MTVEFFRLSGGGNDFLALVEPPAPPAAAEIRAWCTRGLSLGADGLFTLTRRGDAVGMDYWNADGGAADLCLNGTRCAARLAFHLGWADGEVELETGAGRYRARGLSPTEVEVELPRLAQPLRDLTVDLDGRRWEGLLAFVGVPHLVLPVEADLKEAPLATVAPRLRRHPVFGGAGANVDFVRYPEPHRFEIRSYERGVEGETLACGTGVVAAAAAGLFTRRSALPVRAATAGGFELTVAGEVGDHRLPERWSLAGDARLLARGRLSTEAAALPPRPGWQVAP
jgi:diaminopimelate epimerase